MKKLFTIFLVVIFGAISGSAQSPAKLTAAVGALRVEVEGGRVIAFVPSLLTKLKLPRREVKAKDHDGKENTYSGYELREVLKLAGAKFGADLRGANMSYYLLIEATDNYHAVFALPELDDTYTDKIVLLADMQDGKTLDIKNGPWQVIVPDEKKHARWVRQVMTLKVIRAQPVSTIR